MGVCRLIWNLVIEVETYYYKSQGKSISCNEMIKQLPDLKQDNPWLYDVSADMQQTVIRNYYKALDGFYKKRARHPRYKSKHASRKSYTIPAGSKIIGNKLQMPKFREGIKINLDRLPPYGSILKSVTISVSPTGKFYASCNYEINQIITIKRPTINDQTTIGIDLGIKEFAVLSNGEKITNPHYLRNKIGLIKVLSRRLSRCKKGSNRYKRRKQRLARQYERITNLRNNFLHQLSSRLVKKYDTVCIEDLAISNLIKNHSMAQPIGDASWFEFRRQLTYKTEWNGKNLIVIDRFAPSSKMCSCDVKNDSLKLSDRTWICENCGITHDRDIFAANNIRKFGLIKSGMTALGRGDTANISVKADSWSMNR